MPRKPKPEKSSAEVLAPALLTFSTRSSEMGRSRPPKSKPPPPKAGHSSCSIRWCSSMRCASRSGMRRSCGAKPCILRWRSCRTGPGTFWASGSSSRRGPNSGQSHRRQRVTAPTSITVARTRIANRTDQDRGSHRRASRSHRVESPIAPSRIGNRTESNRQSHRRGSPIAPTRIANRTLRTSPLSAPPPPRAAVVPARAASS